jgi:5-methylcytosine-specific restriction endonuclease McrA
MDTDQGATKVCTKCGQEQSVSEFHFKNKAKGVLRSRCLTCERDDNRARMQARYVPHPRPKLDERTCTRCKRTFPVENFPLKSIATGQRRSLCRECRNAESAAWKQKHTEHRQQTDAAYREQHRDELAERQRRWREEHPDEYREIHSRWKAGNKSAVNAATHRRRSKIKGNGGDGWTAQQWEALKAEFDYTCLMCGRQEPAIQLHADHIVPVQVGGTNKIDNIQPLCKSCNSRKHTHILDLRVLWRMTHPKGEPT